MKFLPRAPSCRYPGFAIVGTSDSRQLRPNTIFLMQLTFCKDNCPGRMYVRTFVIRRVPAEQLAVIFELLVSQLQKRSFL